MKAALFCLGNLSLLWLAWRWSASLAARRLDFVVGLAALYPLCAILFVLAGGLTAQLYPVQIALASAALAFVIWMRFGVGVAPAIFGGWRLPRSPASRLAMAAVIAFAAFPLVRMLTAGTGYFIDDFGYHTVAVAAWIQNGDFRQIMPQFTAYFPLNAELLSTWFALPFRHDGLVVLAGLVWLGLATIAAGGAVRLLGGDVASALFTMAGVLASPPIVWQARTFSASDLAGAASLLGAIYFAARSMHPQRIDQSIVAGLLAGLGAGVKATFLPVAMLICLYPLCALSSWRARLHIAAVMSASAAAVGSVWYLNNWLTTGNPLFPAQLSVFAGPLTRAEQADIKLFGLVAKVPWTPRLWGNMIYDYLAWPLPLGLLAAAGYIREIALDCGLLTSHVPEDRALRRLLWICGIAQFVLHIFAPFWIGGGYVDGRIYVYSRYVMPWFLFGLVLAAPLLDSRLRYAWCWRVLAIVGLAMCWPLSGIMRFGGIAVALVGLALLHGLPTRAWKPLALASFIAVWPMLALLESRMHEASHRNLRDFVRTKGGKSLGEALVALDSLPAGTRLTRFANHAYLNSPFFGRDWQLQPVFTNSHGVPLLPLHLQFRANPALTFFAQESEPLPSAHQFVSNLRAAGISHVFVTKFNTAGWPPQQALLEESGEATASFNDGDSALWHLAPPPPPQAR